nr:hypothetical protein [Micromonospora sp. DSM 115978]
HLTKHTGRLWAAAISPDGLLLATAGDDLEIRVWDVETGDQVATLVGHTKRVSSIDFSPDGKMLASCGEDGATRIWRRAELTGERVTPHLTLISLKNGWAAIAWDGRHKMSGDVAGQIWHLIGLCRFELGELDSYLGEVRQLSEEAPF